VARLTAPSLAEFNLTGGRQSVSGNVVTITTADSSELVAAYSLPPDARFRSQHRDYLQPEPFLQARSPAMLRQGIAIIRHEREPGAIVRLLTKWVADSVERTTQPGDPDAADVLRSRKANASGHAQLFTALARSLDIPTRLVSGAVRIDGRWYFHTWAEVFLRDWVAVDPTFGQFPADASHLRLSIGGIERRVSLRRTVRSLHLEVLDAR
jgi:transglutaminase-like putative cysteine protease